MRNSEGPSHGTTTVFTHTHSNAPARPFRRTTGTTTSQNEGTSHRTFGPFPIQQSNSATSITDAFQVKFGKQLSVFTCTATTVTRRSILGPSLYTMSSLSVGNIYGRLLGTILHGYTQSMSQWRLICFPSDEHIDRHTNDDRLFTLATIATATPHATTRRRTSAY